MLTIPGYRILRPLSQGGFGHVHLAQRDADGQQVAIKVLHLPIDEHLRRFYREAKLLHQQIGNPYVVTLYEAGFHHVPQYIAMEYCSGGSLRGWIGHNVDWLQVVFALSNATAGLSKIHEIGGFHRDIKPDNLLVAVGEDGSRVVKVGDFGLARVPNTSTWPMTTSAAGTRGYLAPELYRGEPYDARCDVYSLGITGIELLTGRIGAADVSRRKDIPPQLRELLLSMVRPHPEQRPSVFRCHEVLISVGQAESDRRQRDTAAAQEAQLREARIRDERVREAAQASERKVRTAAAGAGIGLGGIALLIGGIALATMNSRDDNGRWRGRDGRFRGGPWG